MSRRVCACRRLLTESELFAAHGSGSAEIRDHDEPPCVPERIAPVNLAEKPMKDWTDRDFARWYGDAKPVRQVQPIVRLVSVGAREGSAES